MSATCSDSTNVTKRARLDLNELYEWILSLDDNPHVLNNLIKDICGIEYWQEVRASARVYEVAEDFRCSLS